MDQPPQTDNLGGDVGGADDFEFAGPEPNDDDDVGFGPIEMDDGEDGGK